MDNKSKGSFTKQSVFERFSTWFFTSLKTGMFGYFFTSYDKSNEKYLQKVGNLKKRSENRNPHYIRKVFARSIERSTLVNFFPKIPEFLLRISARDYGIVLLVMGIVTSSLYPLRNYTTLINISLETFISGIIIVVCSVPLLFSARSVSKDILSSKLLGKLIFDFIGMRRENFRLASEKRRLSSANISFFTGLLLGVLAYFISPANILLLLLTAILAYSVLTTPEIGVILIIFAVPFASTGKMIAAVVYVFACYLIKCLIGKRTFKFEYFDIWIAVIILMTLFGGVASVDISSSFRAMLINITFIMAYFLISNLIRSKEWYGRCIIAISSSVLIVTVISLFQFIMSKTSTVWSDVSFFASAGEHIKSTFESPSSLGQYLVMTLPFILVYMITKRNQISKLGGFLLSVLSVLALLFTASAASITGCVAAVILLLLIYHKNFIYLVISLCVACPVLYLALPDTAINKIMSFAGFSEMLSNEKIIFFRSVVNMIKAHPFGVGLGDSAFGNTLSNFISGSQGSGNAGNLYLQISSELGIIGLIIFVSFLVVYSKLNFTYCSKSKNKFRRINGCAGFCSVVGILTVGMFDYVWSDKKMLLMFFIAAALSFSYIKIERDDEMPKSPTVDIASASVDILLSSEPYHETVPKRKYVHLPKNKKIKFKDENSIIKEFANQSDFIRVISDDGSEENKDDEPEENKQ